LVASTTSAELTLWRWENLRGWSRLLVEPSTGAVRVALVVSSRQPDEHGVLVGLGRRVFRPLRHAQEVHRRERRPMWLSVGPGPGGLEPPDRHRPRACPPRVQLAAHRPIRPRRWL